MVLARLGRVLLVAAFLLAQHSALAHQVWHFAGGGAQDTQADPSSKSKGHPLCEQHVALGTVLGALNASSAVCLFAEPTPLHIPAAHVPAAVAASFPPASRGPPSAL
jgi:hypothetical protein